MIFVNDINGIPSIIKTQENIIGKIDYFHQIELSIRLRNNLISYYNLFQDLMYK